MSRLGCWAVFASEAVTSNQAFQTETLFAVFSVIGNVRYNSLSSIKAVVDVHSLTAIDRAALTFSFALVSE